MPLNEETQPDSSKRPVSAEGRRSCGHGWLVSAAVVVLALVVFLVVRAGHEPQDALSYSCPSLTGSTSDEGSHYIDLLVWKDVDYTRYEVFTRSPIRPPPPRIGRQLTTVGCNLPDLTHDYVFDIEDAPLPDRTATMLRTGSPVYVIRGFNHVCRIAVHDFPEWKIYAATDLDAGQLKPCV